MKDFERAAVRNAIKRSQLYNDCEVGYRWLYDWYLRNTHVAEINHSNALTNFNKWVKKNEKNKNHPVLTIHLLKDCWGSESYFGYKNNIQITEDYYSPSELIYDYPSFKNAKIIER